MHFTPFCTWHQLAESTLFWHASAYVTTLFHRQGITAAVKTSETSRITLHLNTFLWSSTWYILLCVEDNYWISSNEGIIPPVALAHCHLYIPLDLLNVFVLFLVTKRGHSSCRLLSASMELTSQIWRIRLCIHDKELYKWMCTLQWTFGVFLYPSDNIQTITVCFKTVESFFSE